jgi:hypothetical protein
VARSSRSRGRAAPSLSTTANWCSLGGGALAGGGGREGSEGRGIGAVRRWREADRWSGEGTGSEGVGSEGNEGHGMRTVRRWREGQQSVEVRGLERE